jgi:hypothetical protein
MAAVTAPASAQRRWLAVTAAWLAVHAGKATVRARAWRLHAALPGLAGAGLISAGLGLKFGIWAGFIAAGCFLLRLDSRL